MLKRETAAQYELEIVPVLSHEAFPGRRFITVAEFAEPAGLTIQHVLDLIEEGELAAVDFRGKVRTDDDSFPAAKPSQMGNKTARRCLRIPVAAYDAFIKRRSTL